MSEASRVGARLGVGIVGFGWMGQVHSRAYARLLQHTPRYAGVAAQAAAAPASAASAAGFAAGMQRAGYATDPAYASKLANVINSALRAQRAS